MNSKVYVCILIFVICFPGPSNEQWLRWLREYRQSLRRGSTIDPAVGRSGGCPSRVTCEPAISGECPAQGQPSYCGTESICCPHTRRRGLSCCVPTFSGSLVEETQTGMYY